MFPQLDDEDRVCRAMPGAGSLRVVLDADAYNEVDDQFAIVYALLSRERLEVEALYAAPFHNERSESPADGMERSHNEILRLLDILDMRDKPAVKGSTRFLADPETPCESPAAFDLVERARSNPDRPLYVAATAAITNIASALLLAPDLVERIVVVWLGGEPPHWPNSNAFNMRQDLHAARVILDSGVPLVHIPCHCAASHLLLSLPELEHYARGCGKAGEYLVKILRDYSDDHFGWAKELWDMSAVAYLVDPTWIPTDRIVCPHLNDNLTWSNNIQRHSILNARFVYRNPIFKDFFRKLQKHSGSGR